MDLSVDGYVAASGQGGWAVVANGRTVASGATSGEPSHLVEWRAAAAALAWMERHAEPGEATLRTDSVLVARGLASRRPAMSGEAAEVRAACRQALARLAEAGVRVRVVRVPRESNVPADRAARRAAQGSNA